ncbi:MULTISPECIES: hypothetical protein [unclassified Devosia]|uniref:hypothetical protein n=1 Tax=unclassified Devosia TaxID=196773 RepID=UPI0015522D50|nr:MULTISPECIES: hypothetical protein [unclassified Devosia]
MSTSEQHEYRVESYNTDPEGRAQQSEVSTVFASTPEAAAMKVLHEELHTIGDITRLRARVTQLNQPSPERVTTLYSKA